MNVPLPASTPRACRRAPASPIGGDRHTAATEIRRAFGLEAAQLTLGHSSAQMTDAVDAERDGSKVAEIMRRVG